MTDYQKQATDFLESHSLTFRAVYVGEDCPASCEDAAKGDFLQPGTFPRKNHIHGSHWRVTISGENRGHLTVDFWDSYQDAETRWARQNPVAASELYQPRASGPSISLAKKHAGKGIPKPTAYDMLTCITKSDPYDFENFCGDFGYDTDSRKAEGVYHAVVKEWRQVSRFFTAEELAEAQEIS